MAQVKVYGLKPQLERVQRDLSEAVHRRLVEAFKLPTEKKFQRFFPLEPEHFIYPEDRSERYTILEIGLFEGRSVEAKKNLIRLLIERLALVGIPTRDLEITLTETPRANWGIRGVPGDELALGYEVEV